LSRSRDTSSETGELEDNESDPPNPDPRSSKHDPLKWLDDGLLTGLLTVAQSHFLLEEIFDVFRYFKILTDSPSNISAVNHKDRVISAILSSA